MEYVRGIRKNNILFSEIIPMIQTLSVQHDQLIQTKHVDSDKLSALCMCNQCTSAVTPLSHFKLVPTE